jgi:hypothetical protein
VRRRRRLEMTQRMVNLVLYLKLNMELTGQLDRRCLLLWDLDWAWNDEEQATSESNGNNGGGGASNLPGNNDVKSASTTTATATKASRGDSWTQDCVVALSPMADVLVIAKDEHAVILTCKK